MRTAGLPMYDLPQLRSATDAWWSGIARHCAAAGLGDVPPTLTRPDDLTDHWMDPDLVFSPDPRPGGRGAGGGDAVL